MNSLKEASCRGLSLIAVAACLVMACGGSGPSTTPPTCTTGTEGCACYGNQTCNPGLSCLSSLCVNPASGNGGVGGIGPGTGGAAGGGGTTPGTGGAAPGTGGAGGTTTGSGGALGSGGSSGNLIKNGDFSAGKEYWDLTPQAGEAYSEDYTGGQYCVLNPSTNYYLSFSLGFPPTPSDAFVITPGATYTLSYTASGTYSTTQLPTVQVKIGHVETPYTELYSTTDVVTNNAIGSAQTFTHVISSAAGDTAAGLVFNGTIDYYSEICFDNVVLQKN